MPTMLARYARHAGASALAFLAVAACSAVEGADERGHSTAIINGTPDTTTNEVVAILWQRAGGLSSCTGTYVANQGSTGYVLTAAHCVVDGSRTARTSELVVREGTNYQNPSAERSVASLAVHPRYDNSSGPGSHYDFAMLEVPNAGAGISVIEPMTGAEDNLQDGTSLLLVGYGRTSSGSGGGNSTRFQITLPIDSVLPLTMLYDQQNGGTCNGDSGGPAIVDTPAGRRVAGVISFVTEDTCSGFGAAGRTSAAYDELIQPFIDGQPVMAGTQTCAQCQSQSAQTTCNAAVSACVGAQPCSDLLDCLDGCTTLPCAKDCERTHPAGVAPYDALTACLCNDCRVPCGSSCQADACGFSPAATDCGACFETKCCAEGAVCADDVTCVRCPEFDAPPECVDDAEAQALNQCLAQNCAAECGAFIDCGYQHPDRACSACISVQCCDIAQACQANPECKSCIDARVPAPQCHDNTEFKALEACMAGQCDACPPLDPLFQPPPDMDAGGPAPGTGGTGGTGGVPPMMMPDAAAPNPEPPPAESESSGGCTVSESSSRSGSWIPLAFAFALLARRRRRTAA